MSRAGSDLPLWRFCLAFYQQAGVEQACLRIQDDYGGNVNILLFCCWLSTLEKGLDERQLQEIINIATNWDRLLLNQLRRLRRASKPVDGNSEVQLRFYESVKRLELQAEQLVCGLLYHWYSQAGLTGAEHRQALNLYMERLSVKQRDRQDLYLAVGH